MQLPSVTVIIPTFNYGHYILEAINSILEQTYPKQLIQIIIIDDGSTDNTKEVLQSLIDNNIVLYHYQANKGKASATYKAIQESSGKYLFNLDADDYYFPEKIEKTVTIFESNPAVVHVASPAKFVNDKKETKFIETIPKDILETPLDGNWLLYRFYNNHILYGGGSTYSARASVLKMIEIPDEVDMYIDEFLIMAILPFGKSYFINKPLSVWREHTTNYSGTVVSKEKLVMRGERLLRSSSALLEYIKNNNFSERIVRIYELIHENRKITQKELTDNKTIKDIFMYAKNVFFKVKPGLHLTKTYKVLNRLIPLQIYQMIKSIIG